MRFLLSTLACITAFQMVNARGSSPQRNPFIPENYPGLIIGVSVGYAICEHGNVIFLVSTSSLCPQDVGCYALDRDRHTIKRTLNRLRKYGNEVWPYAPWGGSFPYRVDPKTTNLVNWPNKGKQATCKND